MKKRTIIGLAVIAAAVVTMFAAPTVASAHETPKYTTVLWLIPDDSKGPNEQDQPFVAQYPAADIAAMGKFMECGNRYQVDVYRPLPDGTKPNVLWADGLLRPNHDGGFLAYDLPYTPYATVITDACPVVTPPPVVTPEPTPPVVTEPPVVVPPVVEPKPPVNTPIPIPPVATPEVPSSPDTPTGSTPSTPPTPTAIPTTSNPTNPPTVAPVTPSTALSAAPSQRTAQSDALAYTGSDDWKICGLAGLLLILAGGIVVVIRKITDRKAS